MKQRTGIRWLVTSVSVFIFLSACQVGLEETSEGIERATITLFEVPDTTAADSIGVRIAGVIGTSTAYRFSHIDTVRIDSLFRVVVWGTWKIQVGVEYPKTPPAFDTILVLASPRTGLHYIDLYTATSVLRDSTTAL